MIRKEKQEEEKRREERSIVTILPNIFSSHEIVTYQRKNFDKA